MAGDVRQAVHRCALAVVVQKRRPRHWISSPRCRRRHRPRRHHCWVLQRQVFDRLLEHVIGLGLFQADLDQPALLQLFNCCLTLRPYLYCSICHAVSGQNDDEHFLGLGLFGADLDQHWWVTTVRLTPTDYKSCHGEDQIRTLFHTRARSWSFRRRRHQSTVRPVPEKYTQDHSGIFPQNMRFVWIKKYAREYAYFLELSAKRMCHTCSIPIQRVFRWHCAPYKFRPTYFTYAA